VNGLPIEDGARRLAVAFAGYNADFRAVTRRAQPRFEARDWHGSQQDAVERIDLYDLWVDRTVTEMRSAYGDQATDRNLWRLLRDRFLQRSAGLPDTAFARTFFSSVSRRLFGTVGVDEGIEFAAVDLEPR
jgi:isocitrate dehydrogenase kinase/phosphatase